MSGKNVRRTCSSGISMFGGIIRHCFFSLFIFYAIHPRAIPLSVILVPFNTLFMPYPLMLMALAVVPSVSTLFEC